LRSSPAYFLKEEYFPLCTPASLPSGWFNRPRPFARERRAACFLSFDTTVDPVRSQGEISMTKTARCYATIAVLLLAASQAHAGPCAKAIASVQAQVDAAIEQRANSDGWKPESPNALRGYQPTPRSLVAAEGSIDQLFEDALDSLDRARVADRANDSAACYQELANARVILRQ
jgi:hypothetical protein